MCYHLFSIIFHYLLTQKVSTIFYLHKSWYLSNVYVSQVLHLTYIHCGTSATKHTKVTLVVDDVVDYVVDDDFPLIPPLQNKATECHEAKQNPNQIQI